MTNSNLTNKYLQTLCVLIVFAVGFAASSDNKESSSKYVGTYVLKDAEGVVWTFDIKENYKLTAIKEGMHIDDMYYGEWSKFFGDYITFSFSNFHARSPVLTFPDGDKNWTTDYFRFSDDGWLYKEYKYMESKNPMKRLKMKKKNE